MSTEKLFEKASRIKTRYPTSRGMITVEDLWDLPLSKGPVNLNDIAKSLNSQLKASEEENFVDAVSSPATEQMTLAFEIVKHVIRVRQQELELKNAAKTRQEEVRILDELIARKEADDLANLSVEELKKRRDSLK